MTAPIKTYWWRRQYPHRLNFGDEITAPLVERLTGRRVEWAPPHRCELVGAGSVIQRVLPRQKENRPLFWGTGYISGGAETDPLDHVEALAVRGRSTLSRIENTSPAPAVLGDPGILAPLLVDGSVRKRHVLGVIPHYHDAELRSVQQLRELGPEVRVVDVGWTPQEVAREIAACDAVISSSLHGLIFADALGVPNAHVRLSTKPLGGLYKFYDYYSAYSAPDRYQQYRLPESVPASVNEVVEAVVENYVEPTGIDELQQGLIQALRAL